MFHYFCLADDASGSWCQVLALCIMLPVQSEDEAAAVLWRLSWSSGRAAQRRLLGKAGSHCRR